MRLLKRILSQKPVYHSIGDAGQCSPPLTGSFRSMLIRESLSAENRLDLFGPNESERTRNALGNLHLFFTERAIHRKTELPVNHPDNLDIAVENGFCAFSRRKNPEDIDCIRQLALAFTEYLRSYHIMEAFVDMKAESADSEMLLQKICPENKVLSIFPVEYSRKVLSRELTFRSLMLQINAQENQLGELRGMMRKSLFND